MACADGRQDNVSAAATRAGAADVPATHPHLPKAMRLPQAIPF